MRTAVYSRVSTLGQHPEMQLAELREHAARRCAGSIYLRRFRSCVSRTDVRGNAGSEPATPGAARDGTETSA